MKFYFDLSLGSNRVRCCLVIPPPLGESPSTKGVIYQNMGSLPVATPFKKQYLLSLPPFSTNSPSGSSGSWEYPGRFMTECWWTQSGADDPSYYESVCSAVTSCLENSFLQHSSLFSCSYTPFALSAILFELWRGCIEVPSRAEHWKVIYCQHFDQ